jgi:hypothetical protein
MLFYKLIKNFSVPRYQNMVRADVFLRVLFAVFIGAVPPPFGFLQRFFSPPLAAAETVRTISRIPDTLENRKSEAEKGSCPASRSDPAQINLETGSRIPDPASPTRNRPSATTFGYLWRIASA